MSSISEKGQVTIPKEIRDALRLKAGDKVVFVKRGNEIFVHKAGTKNLSHCSKIKSPGNLGV